MSPSNNRGRPSAPQNQQEQREKLIFAARDLMREKSYKSITIRELAERAKINSAMIRYYFESKEGLFLATIGYMSSQHFSRFQQLSTSAHPIRDFIQLMVSTLAQEKGIARFIHDEVLNGESPISNAFIDGFPKRMAALLPQLVKKEIAAHQPNSDVNAKFAAFNLMSMLMMPIVAEPVRKRAWGMSDEEICSPAWAEHLYQQFLHGCLRG